jgi:hypothetical protein
MVPADIFLAQIIDASLDDRPIYFAMTTQAYEELNLRPFLIRQGVALKLNDGPVEAGPGPRHLRGAAQPAGRRHRTVHRRAAHGGAADATSSCTAAAARRVGPLGRLGDGRIPAYYGYSHMGLGHVYETLGETETRNATYDIAERGCGWRTSATPARRCTRRPVVGAALVLGAASLWATFGIFAKAPLRRRLRAARAGERARAVGFAGFALLLAPHAAAIAKAARATPAQPRHCRGHCRSSRRTASSATRSSRSSSSPRSSAPTVSIAVALLYTAPAFVC